MQNQFNATMPPWAETVAVDPKPRYWRDIEDSERRILNYWVINDSLEKYPGDVQNFPLNELNHQYGRGIVDGIWFVRHYLTGLPAPIAWLMRKFILPTIIRRQELCKP